MEDIVIPKKCPILKFSLKLGLTKRDFNSSTLDRIDNTKGYIKGNIQVISYKANVMKNSATISELKNFSSWVLNKRKIYMIYMNNTKDIYQRFSWLKSRAKKYGIKFNIVEDDIKIPTVCPILKIPLKINHFKWGLKNSISIDRINTNKGYVKGNVQVISYLANRMKNNATRKELINFALWIRNNL